MGASWNAIVSFVTTKKTKTYTKKIAGFTNQDTGKLQKYNHYT